MITFEESKNGRLKVIPPNDKILEDLIDRYSIPNKSARFSAYAPSNLSAISPLGTFDKGLIHDIIHTLKEITYEKIDISNISDYLIKKPIRKNEKLIQPKTFNYRPYQINSINKCLDNGNGLSELPTGAGKSAIIYGICRNSVSKKILILVPNIQLVKQFKKDLIEYGYTEHEVQMYSSFSKTLLDKRITISNRQWLQIHPLDFDIDCLIVDECLKKGTQITTRNGYKKIEDIDEKDIVLSYNIENKNWEWKPVIQKYENLYESNKYDYFLEIELENGKKISVTPNHKIYTNNRGYIRADEINEEDDIEYYEKQYLDNDKTEI